MTALDPLLQGYRRFRAEGWAHQRERWTSLAEGQSPRLLVIACSDSRVDPAVIFDVSPGEIFVVRNVANLVPPFETDPSRHGVSAAVEYAVTQLKVDGIVVIGHEFCGGCQAAMTRAFEGAPNGEGGFVRHWVDMLDEARDRVVAEHGEGDAALRALEREAVRVSLANLRSFPFVAAAEQAGTLTLTGAWFAIRDGLLRILDEQSGRFETV
ncbi:carbonic anhydrase [Sphingomonas morindae]|uniref:Carbonic anhydrase n=1 Tax=Sphingomonas morindae TaxID=1541170 RepID=A0ABY4X7R0_9SPHN|nr:carbonic anhydrase [Sphingomonas morindae]USI72989.1 carbonic anhydrase [Sphingomonas morindae]